MSYPKDRDKTQGLYALFYGLVLVGIGLLIQTAKFVWVDHTSDKLAELEYELPVILISICLIGIGVKMSRIYKKRLLKFEGDDRKPE